MKEFKINEEIEQGTVRVVSEEKGLIGDMSVEDALNVAEEEGYDLVEIAADAQPRVCKIMDYGKYRFEQQKSEKKNRRNQGSTAEKEIRLSIRSAAHDVEIKRTQADKLLKSGNKVKVEILFRGRELEHTEVGFRMMEHFAESIQNGKVIMEAKLEGKTMFMMLAPSNKNL